MILRPLQMQDAPRFFLWLNDPDVNKFLSIRKVTLGAEMVWIRATLKVKPQQVFAIDTKDGVHIGACAIRIGNKHHRSGGFGISIGDKKYWGKGLGTEAMQLLIAYGFENLKLHRIELDVYDYNKRAIALYKKLGFKKEGILREHNFYNGKFHNAIHMAILDREMKRSDYDSKR